MNFNVPTRANLRLVAQIYCPALHMCRRRCRNVTAITYVTETTRGSRSSRVPICLFTYSLFNDAVSSLD